MLAVRRSNRNKTRTRLQEESGLEDGSMLMGLGPGSQRAKPQSRLRVRELKSQQQAVLARKVQGGMQGGSPALPSRARKATCKIDPCGSVGVETLRTAAGVVVLGDEVGVDEIQLAVPTPHATPVSCPAANQIRRAQSLDAPGTEMPASRLSAALVVELEEEGLSSPGRQEHGDHDAVKKSELAATRRSLSLSGRSFSSSRIVTIAEQGASKGPL